MSKIPEYGTTAWKGYIYQRAKEERRGHNYAYWTEKTEKEWKQKGYELFKFSDGKYYTGSEMYAQEEVKKLRKAGNHARIVAGYHKVVQRIQYYSIIYKARK